MEIGRLDDPGQKPGFVTVTSLTLVVYKMEIQIYAQQISIKCLLCAQHDGRSWKYDDPGTGQLTRLRVQFYCERNRLFKKEIYKCE